MSDDIHNQKKLLSPQQVVFRKPADYSKAAVYKCKVVDYSKVAVYTCKVLNSRFTTVLLIALLAICSKVITWKHRQTDTHTDRHV